MRDEETSAEAEGEDAMRDRYVTVLEKMGKPTDFGTHELLLGQELSVRPATLYALVLKAGMQHDDDAVKKFFVLLMHAVDDAVLVPFLVSDEGPQQTLPWYGEQKQRVQEAKSQARWTRTLKALDLLMELPFKTTYAYNETKEAPTLTSSREMIMDEVIRWWSWTEDEAKADYVLYCLFKLSERGRDHSWPKYRNNLINDEVEKAIRKATDRSFPTHRLLRYITTDKIRDREAVVRILAIAFARNVDEKNLVEQFKASAPLFGCSSGAHAFAADIASKIARLDKNIDSLREILGDRFFDSPRIPPGFKYVNGTLHLSYVLPNTIKVVLEKMVSHRGCNKKHEEWFESAIENISLWQIEFPHSVQITTRISNDVGRVIFLRESLLPAKKNAH